MAFRVLSPRLAKKSLLMLANPYRPPEILALKQQIEEEKRALELVTSVTGTVDREWVAKIVAMKLRLDTLYLDWFENSP